MQRALAIAFLLAAAGFASAQDKTLTITVGPVKDATGITPICIPLSLPEARANSKQVVVALEIGGNSSLLKGQLTAPGIATDAIKPAKDGLVRRDLHVVLPELKAETPAKLAVRFDATLPPLPPLQFAWTEKKGEYQELLLTRSGEAKPILRYMDRTYDPSSPQSREKTYKVFHHLYDPLGKRFLTNGGFTDNYTDPKKLLYPHHRGIMYGFNKCSYGPDLKQQADTWHCPPPSTDPKKKTPTAHVAHEKTLSTDTGPVLGRHRVLLGWYGAGDKPFALEERELTVYDMPGGTLVEFASRLKTTAGKVRVDGDPQHAGFQFRAANDVAEKTKKLTYYLHPDGSKGDMGKERNWPQDKGMVDLPWYVLSFVLDDQRYSVCYLNHPSNPKETRFSERDYGRFGGYFQADITEESPLVVNYRLWVQPGEMTKTQAEKLEASFASPPKASVK